MALNSPAVLLVTNDVTPGVEAAFDQWYIDEHLPERAAVPGFRRGRRWRAVTGGPRDLTIYEIDGMEVMRSLGYLARTAAPTPATRAMMGFFIGMTRSVCHVQGAAGAGDGGAAGFLPLPRTVEGGAVDEALARTRQAAGVLAVALLDCDRAASASDSEESRLRRAPDRTIERAIWIEAADQAQAEAALQPALVRLRGTGHAAVELPSTYRLVAGMALA
jgi:hypothetical protein